VRLEIRWDRGGSQALATWSRTDFDAGSALQRRSHTVPPSGTWPSAGPPSAPRCRGRFLVVRRNADANATGRGGAAVVVRGPCTPERRLPTTTNSPFDGEGRKIGGGGGLTSVGQHRGGRPRQAFRSVVLNGIGGVRDLLNSQKSRNSLSSGSLNPGGIGLFFAQMSDKDNRRGLRGQSCRDAVDQ
jgi:hypothetical protein